MKKSYLNLTGKIDKKKKKYYTIDKKKIECIELISDVTKSLAIPFFIIGAVARDMILMHGYGIKTIRATYDIDFAIRVQNWQRFNELKNDLIKLDEITETKEIQRMKYHKNIVFDLIPFGPIADKDSTIKWPPSNDIVFNIIGFNEAYKYAQNVLLREKSHLEVKIVNLPCLAFMKLFSWNDGNYDRRSKDASDLALILMKYTEADNFERILNEAEDLLESEEFDYVYAGARLLGRDLSLILTPAIKNKVLEILNHETEKESLYRLIEDMLINKFNHDQTFEYMLKLLIELRLGLED